MRFSGGCWLPALAFGFALAGCHGATGATAAPHVQIAKLQDLPKPLPKPYDETATPQAVNAALDAAFARAAAGHKRVIVDLGGNWCSWCRMLAAVMELPEVKPFIDANFEVVPVNVTSAQGSLDRNAQVLKRFGMTKVEGFPWLIVAEPDGKVVASSDAVTDDAHHTPQTMVDWLAQYAKVRPS